MPRLTRIAIHPLKSFDPLLVDEAVVLTNGALRHDRRFALVDPTGRFVNAKRTPAVHGLSLQLDPERRTLVAHRRPETNVHRWDIDQQRADLQRWLSDYFALEVLLIEEPEGGFPDDTEATGPTIVSAATWTVVAAWFPGWTLDDARGRFRANLEIAGVDPFWEDRLFGASTATRTFRIGDVIFAGTNPCQRCVVPSRDPITGEVWPEFARRFAELRESHLPAWSARDRFNHFYRLTTNTRLTALGSGRIRVGDTVELVDDPTD